LSPQKIIEPSTGYSSLQRFSTTFQVPYEVLWKYEVYLDGKAYGDVVVRVAKKAEETPITLPADIPDFVQESDFENIDWERKAVEFGDSVQYYFLYFYVNSPIFRKSMKNEILTFL
jgi:hypothetical protein